ncbi:MAG: GFA family protein [Alphaproteobacteria bacterium]
MPVTNSGGCACGATRFIATGEPLRVTICHCKWCQRRTGTAFGVEVVFNSDQVSVTGTDIGEYRHVSDESGRWLDLQFCRTCVGNLGFTLEAAPGVRTLPAGVFDDPGWINAEHYPFRHVYIRSRRVWSELSSNVEVYEEHFRQ